MRRLLLLLSVFAVLLGLALVDSQSSALTDADVTGDFGAPLPGLTAFELDEFERGREIFEKQFARSEGLGPHFNSSSCVSCHEFPVAGGSSQRYRNFFLVGRTAEGGRVMKAYPDCSLENLATQKSELCLPSLVMPHFGPKGTIDDPVAPAVEHPEIPADADVVAGRNAPPIFGIGLFLRVSDEEILSRADPDDLDGDGISGHINRISTEDDAIGRFGYKCQTASIEAFNRGALQNQMGITSDSTHLILGDASDPAEPRSGPGTFLEELFGSRTAYAQVAVPKDRIVDYDGVFDPEIPRSDLLLLIHFQERLAAPRRGVITAAVRLGEEIFTEIGCADCHVPSLPIPSGLIHPYTDLLVHDMGPGLADGVVMEQASVSEFRTQPLWGLCQHAPFLHDGRSDTVEEAILEHGGEAVASRDAFAGLGAIDRQRVLRFLESL